MMCLFIQILLFGIMHRYFLHVLVISLVYLGLVIAILAIMGENVFGGGELYY